jgi:hypothetical protein
MRIVIVGTMASDPYAGLVWQSMQISQGLKQLGHDVYYFEITSTWPYNPVLYQRVNNADYAIPYLKNILRNFGFENRWAYRCSYSNNEWFGLSKSVAEDLLKKADLVFNISGSTKFPIEGIETGKLLYYSTDPVYSEISYAQGDTLIKEFVDEHDIIVSFGENIGKEDCLIPPLPNLKALTRSPIILKHWDGILPLKNGFSTIGNWKQDGRDIEFNGEKYYWSKHHEFYKFMDLPKRTNQNIDFATNLTKRLNSNEIKDSDITSHGVPLDEYDLLESNGWNLHDGPAISSDPFQYRDFIIQSKGEFTFAKDQNIRLQSGWFSDRSACYLAAGRPVITQNTGFASVLPVGEGLFSFDTMEDIFIAFDKINKNYEQQSKAAKQIAVEYFSAEKVLNKLLEDLGY